MENIIVTVKNNKLTLEIDLSKRLRPSSSGKNVLIATGSEYLAAHPEIKVGVNVYSKEAK
jgi:hypothetical protein